MEKLTQMQKMENASAMMDGTLILKMFAKNVVKVQIFMDAKIA